MTLHGIYIERTPYGYNVCWTALVSKYINVRPFPSIVPAMKCAKEAVLCYRLRQRVIKVVG